MKNQLDIDKILICGFGSIGKKHFKVIKENWPSIKLGILSNHLLESDQNNFGSYDLFNNLEMASRWKPSLVIISSPASLHLEQALYFALKDIPLLIEKPIGTGLEKQEKWNKLLKISKKINIKVAYVLRQHPLILLLKDEILKKEYGKLIEVDFYCGSWLPDWREDTDYKISVSSRKELGGGVLLELSHEIDLAYFLFGDLDLHYSLIQKNSNLEIDKTLEDTTILLATNKDNAVITIRLNFCTNPSKREIILRGEYGQIICDLINGKLTKNIFKNKQIIYESKINSEELYKAQINEFFNSFNNKNSNMCDVKNSLKILEFINKARLNPTNS